MQVPMSWRYTQQAGKNERAAEGLGHAHFPILLMEMRTVNSPFRSNLELFHTFFARSQKNLLLMHPLLVFHKNKGEKQVKGI